MAPKVIRYTGLSILLLIGWVGAANPALISTSPDPITLGNSNGMVTATFAGGDSDTNSFGFEILGSDNGSPIFFGFSFDTFITVHGGMISAPHIFNWSDNYATIQTIGTGSPFTGGFTFVTESTPTTGTFEFFDIDNNHQSIPITFSVAPIPIPAAAWLFGSALVLLVWLPRNIRLQNISN
ncbi:MAG: hypothetical protein ABW092_19690 [Candidatus Thiodiazotropha sp.]